MSEIIERLFSEDLNKAAEQARKEGRQEERSDLLSTLIKNGMSLEEVAKFSNIPISEIKQLCTAR